ncbi:hypothetical protein ACQP2P_02665 [Dactylosporangium sp. CA-139114]|uniref:hypothetical protein n=1 Tax=Dactylosporangium sp. CA-139114 TaxID=3239931 RepID=UPI003D987C17
MANRSIQTDPEPEVTIRFSDRQVVWALMALAAVLYAIAAKMRLGMPPLGDEPHYLIESISLGKYHTFDLTQAYANGDFRVFYPEDIQPHVYPNADGVMVPLHNFGGPILWTIPFMIWGRIGAQAVVVLASVLTVGITFRIMRELGIARSYAAIVTGIFVVATPIYMYASMLFIDPFGALFVAYAVRVLVAARPAKWQVALASAGLGWMPWVHGRFTLFTVILGVLLLLRVDRGGAKGVRALSAYIPAAVPMLVLLLALEIFNYTHYHSLNPAPGNSALGDGVLQIPPQRGLAGLLFDRQYGLISHFPVLALAVPGMFLVGRRHSRMQSHWMLLAVILPYMLAISTFRTWWAGFTPPGRLPVVLVPLLAFYVAITLQRLHSWFPLALALATGVFGFLVTFTGDVNLFWRFTSGGGNGNDPVFTWLAGKIRQPDIARFIPAVETNPGTGENYWPFVLAFAVCVAVAVLWGKLAPADRIPDRTLWNYLPTPRELLASVRRRPAPAASPAPAAVPTSKAPARPAARPEPVPVPAAEAEHSEGESDKPKLEWPFPPADRTSQH